jgi:dihydroorotate dehydrogenase
VAAGLVKGDGFADETAAMAAVGEQRDIVPGWRSVPALVGPVEFGSFTRYPRLGNDGQILWRDRATGSMQNRIGLRNPGARAAATYLSAHATAMPPTWGVNVAVSPGVLDIAAARREVSEAAACFHDAFRDTGSGPAWVTLNLSCPNTEDDPHGTQSAELAHALCAVLTAESPVPVWVKIGPDLSDAQLGGLVRVFHAAGIAAVVATNTWGRPAPHQALGTSAPVSAGISGTGLRPLAMSTVMRLRTIMREADADIDIVDCGGITDGAHWRAFQAAGARAAMIYSAMVVRGPLAAALILREAAPAGRHV